MKKLLQQLFGRSPDSPRPAASAAPAAAADPDAAPRPDYRDPEYLRLAGQCALGDIAAMWDMAQWFRRCLRPSTLALLDAYDSGDNTFGELDSRTRYYSPDSFPLRACVTWLGQAARYGHKEARQLTEGRYFYRTCGILKEAAHKVGGLSYDHYYSSDLHNLGLLDIDSGLEEFGLHSLLPEGIYIASCLSDYIPADSDGFGREDTYESIFYDEFFNHIPGRTLEDARRNLPKLLNKRAAYWADPKNNPEHRKYRQLWSEAGRERR